MRINVLRYFHEYIVLEYVYKTWKLVFNFNIDIFNIVDFQSNLYQDGMEMSRPLTAAEVIKGVIDEVFPDGQDEDSNVIKAVEEETFKLPEGVVNIDIEVRNL